MKTPFLGLGILFALSCLLLVSERTRGDAVAKNSAPWISAIADLTLRIGEDSQAIPFVIGDAETPADSLRVSATSSEPTLVWAGIDVAGQGTNRWLMIQSGSVSGDAHITITVTDAAGASAGTTFKLSVVCDGGPTVSAIPDQYLTAGTTTAIPFSLNTCRGDVGNWNVQASSADTNLIPNDHVLVFRRGASGRLLVTPAPGRTGSGSITLVVTDTEQQTSSTGFLLHVDAASGALAITAEPEDVTAFPDETIMFDAGVTSSTPPLFQWFKGASELPGSTNSFLILTNVQASDIGRYRLQIRTDTQAVTTRDAELHVRALVSLSFPMTATDGLITTKVFGERGDRYTVFAGSNVGAWEPGTPVTNEVGWAEYRENAPPARRFYRALLWP